MIHIRYIMYGSRKFDESLQHIQCARAECGHSLLTTADRMGIVHHIAAHIRHDEARLLSRAAASLVVTCDCGMAVGFCLLSLFFFLNFPFILLRPDHLWATCTT